MSTHRQLDIDALRTKLADEHGRALIEVRTSSGPVGTIRRRVSKSGHVSVHRRRVAVQGSGGTVHVHLNINELPDDLNKRGY